MTDNLEDEIKKALRSLGNCFDRKKGELAYLALTSKPEFVIRDRLAWELHKQLFRQFVVAREWKRIDLAILRHQNEPKPAALIQLKTWSLFTFLEDADHHLEKVWADMGKCSKGYGECPTYAVLLSAHINRVPDVCTEGVVKYMSKPNGGWKKAFEVYKTAKKIEDEAKESIARELKSRRGTSIEEGRIQAGEAFETNVDVLYWLIQKEE